MLCGTLGQQLLPCPRSSARWTFAVSLSLLFVCFVQATRDGFTQARGSIEDTKKRVKEAESRIDSELAGYVSKAYW